MGNLEPNFVARSLRFKMNGDEPCITYEKRITFSPKTCKVTKKRIGWFTQAYLKVSEYTYGHDVMSECSWLSKEGYAYLKLKGEV